MSCCDNFDMQCDNTDMKCINFDMQIESIYYVPDNDHNKLSNRDKKDQHPISAISGLQEKIKELASQSDKLDFVIKSIVTNLYGKEEAEKNLAKVINDIQDISDEIIIHSGVYNIGLENNGKIKLKSNKKITFAPNTIINYTAADTEQEKYVLFDFTDCENTIVTGGTFINNALGHIGTVFLLKDCKRCKVENVIIQNAEYGVCILADQKNTEYNIVSNCSINNIQIGILLDATPEDQKEKITYCRYNIIEDCQIINPLINGKIQKDCIGVLSQGTTWKNSRITNLYNGCFNIITIDVPIGFKINNGIYPLMLHGCNHNTTAAYEVGNFYAYIENHSPTSAPLRNIIEYCNFDYSSTNVKIEDYNETNSDYKNLNNAYISGTGLKFNINNKIIPFLSYTNDELRMVLETNKDFYLGTNLDSQLGLTSDEVKIYKPIYFTDSEENKNKLYISSDKKHLTYLDKTLLFTEELLTAAKDTKGIVQIGDNIDISNGIISIKLGNKDNYGLLKVGKNIDVNDNTISIPEASNSTLGLVKGGGNINILNGILNVSKATSESLGAIKIGYTSINKNYAVQLDEDGKAFVNVPWTDPTPAQQYGPASVDALGLVKIGSNIDIDSDGIISIKIASNTDLGLVKIGTGIKIAEDGTISADEVKVATTSVLGGIKAGDYINVSNTGDVTLPIMTAAEITDLFNSVWYGIAN